MKDFVQPMAPLENTFSNDKLLIKYLERRFPKNLINEVTSDLKILGERSVSEILELGYQAEMNPPRHVPYSAWGERIDEIEVSDAWKKLATIAVEEKLIAIAYERKQQEWSRVYQMLKIYLYGPSAALYTCPLAMSDGAARAIEIYGDQKLKDTAFKNLTSTNPENFWTSGQWMTEKTGGSDVAQTSTEATVENGKYFLHGTKWFTSATTSEMTMTLARTPGAAAGGKGLSLFFLKLRDENKKLNNIFIHRLKDKLGTKALPTAELTLQGSEAALVGGIGDGIKKISSLFNITRIWNACTAVSFMRRGIMLAEGYAQKRFAFGKNLTEHALHMETLKDLSAECDSGFLLVMKISELLGLEECGKATASQSALLRILTPLAKLYTAKQSISVSSEVLESFGGAGYVEDTHLPRLLRDSQVLSIWEGTTNVLSLDTLRAIQKENAFGPFLSSTKEILKQCKNERLQKYATHIGENLTKIETYISATSPEQMQKKARGLSYALAETYMAALLLEHCQWGLEQNDSTTLDSLNRWNKKNYTRGLEE